MGLDLKNLKVKLFADGAEIEVMRQMANNPLIKGFTTNPTLMRKAGIQNYEAFARQVIEEFYEYPISLEVFADELGEMEEQARYLATFGQNVYVKIPVTNTKSVSAAPIIRSLARDGVKLNITAIMSLDQVSEVADALSADTPAYVSVFAGRIADTGCDPVPLMQESLRILQSKPLLELLWASPRELLNVFQADAMGCHVITATKDILGKLGIVGKDLQEYSLETVKMFYDDACAAGYSLNVSANKSA
jgi:transaldolase